MDPVNAYGVNAARDHFAHLVRDWSHYGPPLRPSPDDTAVVQRTIDGLAGAPHALVLGVTPEILACSWPPGTVLHAIDHSPAVIGMLWPRVRRPAGASAVLANWCAMPIASQSTDVIVGDGCFIALNYPRGFQALICEVHRVLRVSGRFIIRVFLRPDRAETIDGIADALRRAKVGGVHALKLRLLAALHGTHGIGTGLDDAWQAWDGMRALVGGFGSRRGWTEEELNGIDAYRGLATRYYLPTLAEFRALFKPDFQEVECAWGRYELADRCPTLVFTK